MALVTGNALGIWIAGAGASWKALGLKTAGVHSTDETSKSAGAKGDVPKI